MPSKDTSIGRSDDQPHRGIFSDAGVRRFANVAGIGLLGCVITRAPTLIGKFDVAKVGLELSLNAGYVVIFGPLFLFVATIWAAYGIIPRQKDARPTNGLDRLFAAFLFVLPALAAGFIALQFFLLLAPMHECPTFDRLRYLTDFTLQAFQPEYCMGESSEAQNGQPWLIKPIFEGWAQVLLPLATFGISLRAWRQWTARNS